MLLTTKVQDTDPQLMVEVSLGVLVVVVSLHNHSHALRKSNWARKPANLGSLYISFSSCLLEYIYNLNSLVVLYYPVEFIGEIVKVIARFITIGFMSFW